MMRTMRRGRAERLAPLVALGLLVLGCSEVATGPTRAVPASVRVSVSTARLESLGDTLRLAAEVLDSNGTALPGYRVRWRLERAGVMDTTAATGVFRSVANGEVRVWAELVSSGGGLTRTGGYDADIAAAPVVVTVAQRPSTVTLTSPEFTLWSLGSTLQVTPTVRDARGAVIAAPTTPITWTSSNAAVAVVDSTGRVRAVGEGTVIVRSAIAGVTSATLLQVSPAIVPRFCVTAEGVDESTCVEVRLTSQERVP
jgi:hypothetical protein